MVGRWESEWVDFRMDGEWMENEWVDFWMGGWWVEG